MLITFDGIDSSGKETHVEILTRRLRFIGHAVQTFQTPDYTTPTGKKLKKLLTRPTLHWKKAPWAEKMELFAQNRSEHRQEVLQALTRGEVVLYDRYVPSSLAFFTIEANNPQQINTRRRRNIQKKIATYEYNVNQMPREDASIFLDVPPRVASNLLKHRKKKKKETREYTDSIALQQRLYNEYDILCRADPGHYIRIQCVEGTQLLPINDIAELIWQQLILKFPFLEQKPV